MNYSQIVYEEYEDIRVIRFNRPEVMNCIGPRTHTELVDAWNRFRVDEGLRIEAQCFNRSIFQPETKEGLRRFNKRDHPDLHSGQANQTPGLVKD